jgi:hypothetical protein
MLMAPPFYFSTSSALHPQAHDALDNVNIFVTNEADMALDLSDKSHDTVVKASFCNYILVSV